MTLAAEPSRAATRAAVQLAHEPGCLVSFDPNVRLEVWDSPRQALESILEILRDVDLIKVSSDEIALLTGTTEPSAACRILRDHGPACIVKLGGGGGYYQTATSSDHVSGIAVESVDSLGARNAFVAGLLASLSVDPDIGVVGECDALVPGLRFANGVGATTTTRYGAIPALPTSREVEALLRAGAAADPTG